MNRYLPVAVSVVLVLLFAVYSQQANPAASEVVINNLGESGSGLKMVSLFRFEVLVDPPTVSIFGFSGSYLNLRGGTVRSPAYFYENTEEQMLDGSVFLPSAAPEGFCRLMVGYWDDGGSRKELVLAWGTSGFGQLMQFSGGVFLWLFLVAGERVAEVEPLPSGISVGFSIPAGESMPPGAVIEVSALGCYGVVG